jgi:hypothetical protein
MLFGGYDLPNRILSSSKSWLEGISPAYPRNQWSFSIRFLIHLRVRISSHALLNSCHALLQAILVDIGTAFALKHAEEWKQMA